MNWKEYLGLSEKTLSNEFLIEVEDFHGLHGAIGLITEIQELVEWKDDLIGKTEEIADIAWYLAIFGRQFNIEKLPSRKKNINTMYDICKFVWKKQANRMLALEMYDKSAVMLDIYKKKTFYGKEIDQSKVESLATEMMSLMMNYCDLHKIDIHESFNRNINKLKKRFGDKFNSNGAINRDLDAERLILEGK